MLLRNNARRLITINGQLSDNNERLVEYDIKPGENPPVEVPNKLCENSFVRGLIESGDLIVLSSADSKEPTADDLRAELDKRGIAWDGRWSIARLQDVLAEAE